MSAKAVELMNKTFLKEAEQKATEDQGIEEAFAMASSFFGKEEGIRYFTQEYNALLNEGEEEEVTIRNGLNTLGEKVINKVGEKVVGNLGENILAGGAGLALLAKQVALDIKAMTSEEIEKKLAEMQPPTPAGTPQSDETAVPGAAVAGGGVAGGVGITDQGSGSVDAGGTNAAEVMRGKTTINLDEVEMIADPYDRRENSEGKMMTYCSQTAQDNAKKIFGLIFPGGDGSAQKTKEATEGGNIQGSRKSGESVEHYISTIANVTDNSELGGGELTATVADLFVSSSSRHGHRALAFATLSESGEQNRYVLDPYRNIDRQSTRPIPLSEYTANIERIDYYSSETVIVENGVLT